MDVGSQQEGFNLQQQQGKKYEEAKKPFEVSSERTDFSARLGDEVIRRVFEDAINHYSFQHPE